MSLLYVIPANETKIRDYVTLTSTYANKTTIQSDSELLELFSSILSSSSLLIRLIIRFCNYVFLNRADVSAFVIRAICSVTILES